MNKTIDVTPEWYLRRMAETAEDGSLPSKEMIIDALKVGASEIDKLKTVLSRLVVAVDENCRTVDKQMFADILAEATAAYGAQPIPPPVADLGDHLPP